MYLRSPASFKSGQRRHAAAAWLIVQDCLLVCVHVICGSCMCYCVQGRYSQGRSPLRPLPAACLTLGLVLAAGAGLCISSGGAVAGWAKQSCSRDEPQGGK